VEIKTFGIASFITALHEAVGKYIVYREALFLKQSDRVLYLALPVDVYKEFGSEMVVQRVFQQYEFKIILYDPITQKISSWIK
jgi:hypothetical protein